ncbi:hypothetical protein E8E13_008712 [Curvularia kusanoi]|uniref:CBM1 domain-containing protein n=1 Tax=Curvularia kusanoi TaxID=90978 RepID=A0A9P4WBZ3_CURKU|nr:hypothetical protein E8E13_008712 [Curvularia kusanoi]
MHLTHTISIALLSSIVSATVGDWQQCGGLNYGGDTVCNSGAGKKENGGTKSSPHSSDYYSQCQPGAAGPTTTLLTSTKPSPPAASKTTTLPAGSSAPAPTGTPAGDGPGATLQTGYYWIRAVAAPNFHKYLQTKPLYSTGAALLGDYTTAGQFQVVDGQLVQLVSAPGAAVKLLYAVVSETRYINDNSLSVTFSATKNTYGAFAWQGDGLTWSVAGVTRPNSAAWYVCGGQQLYINLGNYLYQTPAGCADQTIHYYNDKTANS